MAESIDISCKRCGKHMGVLRDARTRKGMVVYCAECDDILNASLSGRPSPADMPEFMRDIFGGKGWTKK